MTIEKILARHDIASGEGLYAKVTGFRANAIYTKLLQARSGEVVRIYPRDGAGPRLAQVVSSTLDQTILLPLDQRSEIGLGDRIERLSCGLDLPKASECLGRVLNGIGQLIDQKPRPSSPRPHNSTPRRQTSSPQTSILATGVRAIDAFTTLGKGQRIGLFAGSGVGKTTLLRQVSTQAVADVVVLCLIGERSRELMSFQDHLDRHASMASERPGDVPAPGTILVCSAMDDPPLARMQSLHVATTLATTLAQDGKDVLLLVDSLSRFARAAREVALITGEHPIRRGYPASVFSQMAAMLERPGVFGRGSVTAMYTVLVEGDDLREPVADATRGMLDGHIVLSRAIAETERWPAIDISKSVSRLMGDLVTDSHLQAATQLRRALALYESKRLLIDIDAYVSGSDPVFDRARLLVDDLKHFLSQSSSIRVPYEESLAQLVELSSRLIRDDPNWPS